MNSSKTEFLLIGLSKQLAKIHKSSLNTTQSARNLGFIFDEHLTFSDQNSSVSKSYSSASLYPSITQYQNSFHHRHFHCSLQAWLLQLSLSQPAQVSDHPAPTDPELSCTCCCQSSQIQSHHSHPSVSALVKDNWAHWIQAPITYRCVFPVGSVSVPISPVKPPWVLCAIACVRRSVKWVRCAFASVTVLSVISL